jgi:radical SAM-linked protein
MIQSRPASEASSRSQPGWIGVLNDQVIRDRGLTQATATAEGTEATAEGTETAPAALSLRLRLQYTKRPPASYLSHLDLVRHVPRILRRAGLRPRYSQGFNPRPRLQFTPPLPVGAEADADLCDVWITGEDPAPPPATDVLSRLDAVTLPGLVFTAARWLTRDEPTVSALCEGARYRFLPGSPIPAERHATLKKRLGELLARPRWEVQRKPKKKGRAPRVRDVRPSLTALEVETVDGQLAVGFTLCRSEGGSLRPRELLEAVFGEPDPAGRLVRRHHLGCGGGRGCGEDREVIGLA